MRTGRRGSLSRALGLILGPIPGWYMITVEPRLRSSRRRVLVTDRGVTFDLNLSEFVERKFYCRAYERRELAFLRRWLSPGDLMVDVGANVGLIALRGARAVAPGGSVLAIEPVPANVERLRVNVTLNPDLDVSVLDKAAGAKVGVVSLGLSAQQASVGNHGSYSSTGETGSMEVERTMLHLAVERWHPRLPPGGIRLVKIDVEGMELEVVRGGFSLFDAHVVDCVMLEINPRFDESDIALSMLEGYGYRVFRLGWFGRLRPIERRSRILRVFGFVPDPYGSWLRGESRLETAVALAPEAAERATGIP